MNPEKSEIVCSNDAARGFLYRAWPGARLINPEKATLLGSPIRDISCITTLIEGKIEMLRTVGERLKHLFSHDAILLLRHSFAILELFYNLRTASCFLSLRIQEHVNILRSVVIVIVNIHLSEQYPAWIQTMLPVKNGGLGIRNAVQLALSPFWLLLLSALSEFFVYSLHISKVLHPHLYRLRP